mmetsp:Transcript_7266/g.10209  ORF Transcript_7266/g.10209 Transcript_7266/m.10209 type:complete len:190 (+) Transcript_7266:319-888(+)|eukprot:CAMPEP_0185575744 /NCGR_PEP_ID=MMETSP0434-20130131/6846_1 /TAXON_ID=626734 ORGANISM="Favella taraikaensis, Strain Fe Narragansett Bay" /NCGR_SAMPLE_ID=MMETSP0434 /ASSEMBLY_ACC=CAM_ASM_000379 /LENGTH=189 /DNA_ID=CAMNT_0028192699 /DNA_START=290 /DNA_END=859 /DNA_ORIENTATION=+
MLQLAESSDEADEAAADEAGGALDIKDSEAWVEETTQKVEKRADLLAMTLQTVISMRKPFCKASDPTGLAVKRSKFGFKNDPFRKNQSYNSLLQACSAAGGNGQDGVFECHERLSQFQEIRQRLLDRCTSVSSHSGSARGASPLSNKNLAKPVVHENLYVYAADKTDRGMALAEKWRLTLVQPSGSSSH